VHPKLGQTDWLPGAAFATALVTAGWGLLVYTGSIDTIWPMFGIANQLLACAALAVGTTIILREAPERKYALVTLLPLCFVATTTITAGVQSVIRIYYPMALNEATRVTGMVNLLVTTCLLMGITFVIVGCARLWLSVLRVPPAAPAASTTV